jgi:hypothetical protein
MEISKIYGKTIDNLTSDIKFSGKIKSQILSFNTNSADRTVNILKWNIVNTKNYNQGDVNTSEKLSNVIGMRLHPFRMRTYDISLTPSLPRWYVGIKEFYNQSFLVNSRPFHFVSNIDTTNYAQGTSFYTEMQTYPFNQGYFWFNEIYKVVDSITIDIYNVFGKLDIRIPTTQTVVSTVVQNSNPLTFSMTNSNIRTGDIITITGFTTGNPVGDAALITSVNTYQNYIYVNTNNTAYINIDASAMTPSGSPINITITTTPYTLLFPIEFIYYDKEDN